VLGIFLISDIMLIRVIVFVLNDAAAMGLSFVFLAFLLELVMLMDLADFVLEGKDVKMQVLVLILEVLYLWREIYLPHELLQTLVLLAAFRLKLVVVSLQGL
jgi:hypothetical protein